MKVLQTIIILLALVNVTVAQQDGYTMYSLPIDSLKKRLVTAKEDTTKVRLLYALSSKYTWSYADTSILFAQQAMDLAQQLNYKNGIEYGYHQISGALTTLGNYPLALEYAFKSLSFAEQKGNIHGIAFSNMNIGMCYRELGDYKNSLIYYRKALALSKGLDLYDLGTIWGTIASVYEKNNQYDSAILYATKSYKIDNKWSGLLFVLGSAYAKKKEYDSAMYFYRQGLTIAEQNNTQIDLLDIYNGMAGVQIEKFAIDSAIWYSKKALAEQVGKTYPLGQLNAAYTLANIFDKQNKSDSTLKYLKIAIALKDSLFNREKTMAVQNLDFKEKEKQKEIEASRLENRNRIRTNAMLGSLFTLAVIAFLLFRNNRMKQLAKLKIEKSYDQLKATQSQLIQSEKMASLGELTAGIAHEIQNPLNFVNNFSELNTELIEEAHQEIEKGNISDVKSLLKNIKDNEEKINQHGKRADGIVKGMLQHSRSSGGAKERTDINALADEYLRLAFHGWRAKDKTFNVNLTTEFDNAIMPVDVVRHDIGRVILNLINNAFYAVTERKKQNGIGYEPMISVSTRKSDGRVLISITDNGNGIPEKVLDKIFQPFFTTKPTGQGTGLGLSLSYDIVKAHGGELKVKTMDGQGSDFSIQLPAS
ncbi:MAG TPA: ATP-binding protein [Chryseolinea sp.]|nr:ATP-binding protein [Chryseolinea sp.]